MFECTISKELSLISIDLASAIRNFKLGNFFFIISQLKFDKQVVFFLKGNFCTKKLSCLSKLGVVPTSKIVEYEL